MEWHRIRKTLLQASFIALQTRLLTFSIVQICGPNNKGIHEKEDKMGVDEIIRDGLLENVGHKLDFQRC